MTKLKGAFSLLLAGSLIFSCLRYDGTQAYALFGQEEETQDTTVEAQSFEESTEGEESSREKTLAEDTADGENETAESTEETTAKTKSQTNSTQDSESVKKSIKEKEDAIKKAKEEKETLKNGLTNTKKVIQGLQNSKGNLEKYVSELDQNLTEIEARIEKLENQITQKRLEIEQTKKELEEAIRVAEEQYEAMKKRITFIYESQSDMMWEVLLTSGSFADLINKADYIEQMSAYDRNMLDNYKQTCEEVKLCKEQLELEEEILEKTQESVEEEKKALDLLISEKKNEIESYEKDINNREKLIKEYQAEIDAQNAEIKALEQAVAEEKKRLEAQNGTSRTYDGGVFQWPCPNYSRISEEYGNRIHPILKVPQFHNGLDIAAPAGSAILAAYDGDVVSAAYSSTMGNYIMIDHGNSLYTIYMHASALYVSKGDTVKRGDKIAAVGSTGRSTGNHLHFSVRLNGNYVSPWNYISK